MSSGSMLRRVQGGTRGDAAHRRRAGHQMMYILYVDWRHHADYHQPGRSSDRAGPARDGQNGEDGAHSRWPSRPDRAREREAAGASRWKRSAREGAEETAPGMIPVDTSVWIDHLHKSIPALAEALEGE